MTYRELLSAIEVATDIQRERDAAEQELRIARINTPLLMSTWRLALGRLEMQLDQEIE